MSLLIVRPASIQRHEIQYNFQESAARIGPERRKKQSVGQLCF